MKLKNVFRRKEKKYALSMEQYFKLRESLSSYMSEDIHGLHTIISLYFDTDDYEMIRRSMEKPKYKEKFRLRSYGVPTNESSVFLEIKKKVCGVVYKRRLASNYQESLQFLAKSDRLPASTTTDKQIQQEIEWLFTRKQLSPKVMIAYDRIALFYAADEDFRITFDFNIRYRLEDLDITHGDYGELVAPEIEVLMEVKAIGAYPIWFSHLLSEQGIFQVSFSKYAQVYQRYIYLGEELLHVV